MPSKKLTAKSILRYMEDAGDPYDYRNFVKAVGNPVVRIEEGDGWTGEELWVLERDGRYGIGGTSWGTCEYCCHWEDAQARGNAIPVIQSHLDEMEWRDTPEEVLAYCQKYAVSQWIWERAFFSAVLEWVKGDEDHEEAN